MAIEFRALDHDKAWDLVAAARRLADAMEEFSEAEDQAVRITEAACAKRTRAEDELLSFFPQPLPAHGCVGHYERRAEALELMEAMAASLSKAHTPGEVTA